MSDLAPDTPPAGAPPAGTPSAGTPSASTGRDRGLAVALLLAAVGLAVWAALLARQSVDVALAPRDLGAMTPAGLDTVAFGGRRLTASLGGYVAGFASPTAVWIADDGDAFRVVFPEPPDLGVEDRVLVVGRLRGRGGTRWLEAEEWTPVDGVAR